MEERQEETVREPSPARPGRSRCSVSTPPPAPQLRWRVRERRRCTSFPVHVTRAHGVFAPFLLAPLTGIVLVGAQSPTLKTGGEGVPGGGPGAAGRGGRRAAAGPSLSVTAGGATGTRWSQQGRFHSLGSTRFGKRLPEVRGDGRWSRH